LHRSLQVDIRREWGGRKIGIRGEEGNRNLSSAPRSGLNKSLKKKGAREEKSPRQPGGKNLRKDGEFKSSVSGPIVHLRKAKRHTPSSVLNWIPICGGRKVPE